jgi:hypothetical protein
MRSLLAVIALCLTGCSTSSTDPLPKQPDAPTSETAVSTLGKEWDKADAKVAASVSIARENADRPDVVRGETTVALSFLPVPAPEELALARARAANPADQKAYGDAVAYGKKLLAKIEADFAKVQADQKRAFEVSQLKDARIVELTKAVEQAKKDAAANLWTLAGIAVAVLGAAAMVFTGPRIGGTLLACGAAIGAFPFVVESEYFSYIAGGTLALAAGLGIYWLWDRVRDSANAPYEPPQK